MNQTQQGIYEARRDVFTRVGIRRHRGYYRCCDSGVGIMSENEVCLANDQLSMMCFKIVQGAKRDG